MSRQSKAAKRKIIAATFTKLHQQGQKGPSRTTPAHGKVLTFKELARRKRVADEEKAEQQAHRDAQKATAKKDEGKKPAAKKTGYQGKNPRPQAKPAPKAAKQVAAGTISK